MTEEAGVPSPNYTQIPNMIFDLMPLMNDTELRVVLFIARQTFGWHKKRDKLSISQIMQGTGLSNGGVILGVEAGIERGLIRRTAVSKSNARKGFYYSLLVKPVHKPCELSTQALVKPVHIQKKGKETIQKKDDAQTPPDAPTIPAELPAPAPRPPLEIHHFIEAHKEIIGMSLNRAQRAQLEDMPCDAKSVEQWRDTLKTWALNGWNPRSFMGMVDRYQKGNAPLPAPGTPAIKTQIRDGVEYEFVGGAWYRKHQVGANR